MTEYETLNAELEDANTRLEGSAMQANARCYAVVLFLFIKIVSWKAYSVSTIDAEVKTMDVQDPKIVYAVNCKIGSQGFYSHISSMMEIH